MNSIGFFCAVLLSSRQKEKRLKCVIVEHHFKFLPDMCTSVNTHIYSPAKSVFRPCVHNLERQNQKEKKETEITKFSFKEVFLLKQKNRATRVICWKKTAENRHKELSLSPYVEQKYFALRFSQAVKEQKVEKKIFVCIKNKRKQKSAF